MIPIVIPFHCRVDLRAWSFRLSNGAGKLAFISVIGADGTRSAKHGFA